MKTSSQKNLLALAAALALSGAAQAAVFVANLEGAQEVPPNASPGTGSATLLVNDATLAFTLTGSYSGLLADVTAAHIHAPALPGVNAGVIVPLAHTGGTAGTLSGAGVLTAEQFGWIQGGLAYVNVHTGQLPGGEIRGQLVVPEPGTYAVMAGLGLCAFAAYRRFRRS